MQYTAKVCAIGVFLLFLSACSSNLSPESNRQENNNSTYDLSSIPRDGKLRAEHVRMYVSVKIKQEQLRFESKSQQQINDAFDSSYHRNARTTNTFEKAAIEHFEFDSQVYFWSKNVIDDILINYTDSDSNPRSSMSNIGNPTIAYNLAMLTKFKDDLRFAKHYRIDPKLLTTSRTTLARKPST